MCSHSVHGRLSLLCFVSMCCVQDAGVLLLHVLVNFNTLSESLKKVICCVKWRRVHLIQWCQGYGPRAGLGPTVRHIRPADDKGRILLLFFYYKCLAPIL